VDQETSIRKRREHLGQAPELADTHAARRKRLAPVARVAIADVQRAQVLHRPLSHGAAPVGAALQPLVVKHGELAVARAVHIQLHHIRARVISRQ
jgi:hypothetical protein